MAILKFRLNTKWQSGELDDMPDAMRMLRYLCKELEDETCQYGRQVRLASWSSAARAAD